MKTPRIIFLGTPEFAVAILETLLQLPGEIDAVVCQPDKETGRHHIMTPPPAKQWALQNHIEVLQPHKLKAEYEMITSRHPDIIITCAYGQFIPDEVLNCAPLRCINIHPSLLPKLRGGAPIQRAVLNGLTKTGVTLMITAPKMDAGDIIAQTEVEIGPDVTSGQLAEQLMPVAKKLLKDNWDLLCSGNYQTITQDESQVTFGYNILPADEHVDFTKPYQVVYNQIRGLIPVPVGYAILDGRKLKFWQAETSELTTDKPDGTIVFVNHQLGIAVGKRLLLISQLQPEGKGVMSAQAFCNGAGRNAQGKVFQ